MLKARSGDWQVDHFPRFISAVKVNNARRLLEGKAAKEKIVHETEDGGVQADSERERDHRDGGEGGRLSKFAKRKANVVHMSFGLRFEEIILCEGQRWDRRWRLGAPATMLPEKRPTKLGARSR